MRQLLCTLGLAACLAGVAAAQEGGSAMDARVPEDVYRGEMVGFPGPWAFQLPKAGIIIVRDEELVTLSEDPDRVIDLSVTFDKQEDSLRGICEKAKASGSRTLLIAFDHFFKQYRAGQDDPRALMPDTDEYIARIGRIAQFAQGYGLELELSLLSPLEVGPGYRRATGESGLWMHYRKGLRDPLTGRYSVELWRQEQWCNNKGPVTIEDAGVRVFAFRERRVGGTPYLAVDPGEIVEITDTVAVEPWDGTETRLGDYRARRVRIHGEGRAEVGPLDRVLVVQQYRTPEMDYFSDKALPFLTDLGDRYADAGIRFSGLYSDEMHIQQDWGYFSHHDDGEFCLRYVSDGLRARFAQAYGAEYGDFAKYLVYFVRGQEGGRNDLDAKLPLQHVFGPSPEEIQRTALFRARYYRFLQDGVVDLFVAAKRHLEDRMGHTLETRAHATWAESPTIDRWEVGHQPGPPNQYEYTSNFVWSNTVHQSAAACDDYFKWGEFLTGTGNDHSEGGWLDRDYYGLALGCSTGIVNEVPYSYAAHWGSPAEIGSRHGWLQATFGTASSPWHGMVQEMQHRDVDVLLLYPLNLVAADERFGSWIVQYGYANYITPAKLAELGTVRDGAIEMAGRRFTTLAALYEPFPSAKLLTMMRDLADQGGRVIWAGPAPALGWEGDPIRAQWQDLFAVDCPPRVDGGLIAPGRIVEFEGSFASVQPQVVLTDLLVDRLHPCVPREGAETVATAQGHVVGTRRATPAGGSLTFLGFRPRDDQSQSLGYDQRTLFDILVALGAYGPTGRIAGTQDNTEYLSRTGEYLTCRFPNGAVSICRHLRQYSEDWPGGFARRPEEDAEYLRQNPPPAQELHLAGFQVNGHEVTAEAFGALTFRVNEAGDLIAFAGHHINRITVDGREWVLSEGGIGTIAWAPVPEGRRVPGGAVLAVYTDTGSDVRIPAVGLPAEVEVFAQGATPGSKGEAIPHRIENGALVLSFPENLRGRLYYVVAR